MATAGDLITAAFIKVGVETPTTAQTASALISLNNMLSLMGIDLPYGLLVRESFAMVIADTEYTIGTGGQWDTTRPNAVTDCFLRDADDYDYPVHPINGRQYGRLSNKSYTARPTELLFVAEYPLAKVIFNASPDIAYDAHFEFAKNLTEFAATGTTVSLPNEYKEFFVYNLAVSLGEDWDRVISKTVYARATETKQVIGQLMASQRPPAKAKFDFRGLGSGRASNIGDGSYSITTDGLIDGGSF